MRGSSVRVTQAAPFPAVHEEPNLAIVNQDMAVLRSALRIMDEQRSAQREKVREAVKASSVPMPPEVVEAISQLNRSDARDVMREPSWAALP